MIVFSFIVLGLAICCIAFELKNPESCRLSAEDIRQERIKQGLDD